MKKQKLINALEKLAESFKEVQSAWEEVPGFPDGTPYYPFEEEFDYLVSKVLIWRDQFTNELRPTPEGSVYLCTCNNCGTLIEDENPKVGAKMYKIEELKALPFPMRLLSIDGDIFWGCPNCETDEHLSDEVGLFLKDSNFENFLKAMTIFGYYPPREIRDGHV